VIPASRPRNYLQAGLYVVIAGVLAAVLLEKLLTYAEATEKAAMEATVSRLTSAMYARLALHVLRGETREIEALETESPFRTARAESSAYLGEFDGMPASAEGGRWYFDRGPRELVYVPNLKRHLHGTGGGDAPATIRYKAAVRRSDGNSYAGVALVPASDWRWDPRP
jgi:hypothetical protein